MEEDTGIHYMDSEDVNESVMVVMNILLDVEIVHVLRKRMLIISGFIHDHVMNILSL
jgi:hypothetical protein